MRTFRRNRPPTYFLKTAASILGFCFFFRVRAGSRIATCFLLDFDACPGHMRAKKRWAVISVIKTSARLAPTHLVLTGPCLVQGSFSVVARPYGRSGSLSRQRGRRRRVERRRSSREARFKLSHGYRSNGRNCRRSRRTTRNWRSDRALLRSHHELSKSRGGRRLSPARSATRRRRGDDRRGSDVSHRAVFDRNGGKS